MSRIALLVPLLCAAAQDPAAEPVLFDGRGRLVCLLEEMKEKFKAAVPPVHAHLPGFRLEKAANGTLRYYTLLRTPSSEALFDDARFKQHELRLRGRVFPSTGLLEVGEFQWYRDGKLYDTFYWCEICSIRSVQPGICVCCQDPVEFREAPAEADKNK